MKTSRNDGLEVDYQKPHNTARTHTNVLADLSNSIENNGEDVKMSKSEWDVATVISKAIMETEMNGFSLKRQMAFVQFFS